MVLRIFFSLLLILPLAVDGQTIETEKQSSRIDGVNATGYQVIIAAPEEDVQSSLARYLKAIGKTKVSGDYVTVAEPLLGGKKYSGILYGTTKRAGNSAAAWIGIAETGEESTFDRDIANLVYGFGISFHREKIQIQIDESLRALQIVEKQQLRLANQNKDLKNRIESNQREKVQLERSVVENKVELEDLTKKLSANHKAQDSVAIATEQIKKVVEMHKQKQQNIK